MAERELIYRIKVINDGANSSVLKSYVEQRKQADNEVASSRVKTQDKAAKEEERRLKERTRAEERELKERVRVAGRLLDQQVRDHRRAMAEQERETKRAVAAQERAARATVQAWNSAQQRLRSSRNLMVEGFNTSAEAAARLARGISLLGLVGEKDLAKIGRSLLVIQGAFDLVVGGVKIYNGLTKAVEGYRMAVLAAAAAESALAAARAQSAAAGGVGGARGVAGNIGGAVAGGAAARLAPGVTAAFAPGAITAGAALAATASSALAGVVVSDSLSGRIHDPKSVGGMIAGQEAGAAQFIDRKLGSFGGGLIGGLGGPVGMGIMGQARSANANEDRLSRVQKASAAQAEANARREGLASIAQRESEARLSQRLGTASSLRSARDVMGVLPAANQRGLNGRISAIEAETSRDIGRARNPDDRAAAVARRDRLVEFERSQAERQRSISGLTNQRTRLTGESDQRRAEIRDVTKAIGSAQTEADTTGLMAQRERLVQAEVDAQNQRLSIEKQISEERRQSVREAIQGAETELKITRDRVAADKERLKSATERFGALSVGEQRQAIAAKEKADKFGAESLTRFERDALRKVGTSDAESIVSKGDIAAAERGGFSKFFGAEDRKRIKEGETKASKLEVEIKGKRELLLKLDDEERKAVDVLIGDLSKLLEERDQAVIDTVKQEVERLRRELAGQNRQQLLNRDALAKGF